MKILYAISRGSYSDYRVVCVADTPEKAEGIAAYLNKYQAEYSQHYEVEEMHHVEDASELRPTKIFEVFADWHGREEESGRKEYYAYPWEAAGMTHHGGWGAIGISDKSFDHALKSARDHITQLRADCAERGVAPWWETPVGNP